MLTGFFLRCIVTEIWWIGKMRRLRDLVETEAAGHTETTVSANPTAGGGPGFRLEVGTEESLLSLRRHLSEKPATSPVPQGTPEIETRNDGSRTVATEEIHDAFGTLNPSAIRHSP
jgi:hypothetical protein